MSKIDESEWKDAEIEFLFDDKLDSRVSRNKAKGMEDYCFTEIGGDNRIIEKKINRDLERTKWKEWWRMEREKKSYKNFDLISGYENRIQWRIRMKINEKGKIYYWIAI